MGCQWHSLRIFSHLNIKQDELREDAANASLSVSWFHNDVWEPAQLYGITRKSQTSVPSYGASVVAKASPLSASINIFGCVIQLVLLTLSQDN